MKILHVISDLSPSTGGPVTAVLGMAKSQSDLGHDVSIAATTLKKNNLPEIDGINLELHQCQYKGWKWAGGLSRALSGLIGESDIVHIHTIWEYPTYAASSICRKTGKPYILRPCGMLDRWSLSQSALKKRIYWKFIARPIISGAAAVHFTSTREFNNSLLCDNANDRFTLPLGLLPSAYQNLPGREIFFNRFPELNGKRLVLYLGRLHHKKQPDMAIKSFYHLSFNDPSIHLVIAGAGNNNYVAKLKKLVARLGLQERVTFTGMLDREAVREAYSASEIFILPSLQENFGISVAEAMAAGCPVIVSDEVDLSPDIKDACAGLVCKPLTEITASAAISDLLKNDSLRKSMGRNARQLIMEKFTWNSLSKKLFNIYEDVIAGKQINPTGGKL